MKRVIFVLLAMILLGGCGEKEKKSKSTQNAKQSQKSIKKLQPKIFHLKSSNGSEITIQKEQEQFFFQPQKDMVLLFFFTPWCPSCKAELIELKQIQKDFPNLFILGILLDKPAKQKEFFQRYGIDFFVSTSYKTNEALARAMYTYVKAPGNMPVPMIVLFKKNSYLIHYLGAVPYEIIASDIKRAKEE